MMRAAMTELRRTGRNGVGLIAIVAALFAFGPRLELWLAPPVSLWEINRARIEGGEAVWSVVVAQVRDCRAAVTWRIDGATVEPSGPPFDFRRGEAAEIGSYRAPVRPGAQTVSATVIYNCGTPWGLAPIEKTAPIAR
jgi:hypothetical protein